MDRRAFLATAAVGVAGLGGCAGGKVRKSVKREVSVDPAQGWIVELPEVGNGSLSFIARSASRFDVYLFDQAAYRQYDTYTDGGEAARMPRGEQGFSQTAVPTDGGDEFVAATDDRGSRQGLPGGGPYYFVVDHSNYGRGTPLHEQPDPISVFVNLEVVEKTMPI